jgi:hypothetical protein
MYDDIIFVIIVDKTTDNDDGRLYIYLKIMNEHMKINKGKTKLESPQLSEESIQFLFNIICRSTIIIDTINTIGIMYLYILYIITKNIIIRNYIK